MHPTFRPIRRRFKDPGTPIGILSAAIRVSLALLWIAIASAPVGGQSTDAATLNGVVLNAATNQPLARALVRLGGHSILTDRDGTFQFSGSAGTIASLEVIKPGFYAGPEANTAGKPVSFTATAAEPLKVYLYPEALITGTLSASNGDPLVGIFVQALGRSNVEQDGGTSWVSMQQTRTDSDGNFRIPLPAGDYMVETQYQPAVFPTFKAVLPILVPDAASSAGTGTQPLIHLAPGSEQHFDLRPPLRASRPVHLRWEGSSEGAQPGVRQGGLQGFPQVQAHLANGLSFNPQLRPAGATGEFAVDLPVGHYTLSGTLREGEATAYAETAVDVPEAGADAEAPEAVLHLTRSTPLTVEMAIDSSSQAASQTSDNQMQPPNLQQLGLRFIRLEQVGAHGNQDSYLQMGRGGTASFALLPGKYRLAAQTIGQWFIKSATVGGTDLLAQELDVEPGGTSAPLRLTLSNQAGSVKGEVKLDGDPAVYCIVYLLPTSPSAARTIVTASGAGGSFASESIPPGSYRAIAFETHVSVGLSDPATLDKLAPYIKSFSVAAGEVAMIELDAVPTRELLR